MRKKKNRFLLFCCSFVPGAGELFLGFMNMGLSLMISFAVLTVIVGFTGIGILSIMPAALWAYSFFHANNLGGLSDEEFYSMEDTYLFGFSNEGVETIKESLSGRYKKVFAVVLILLGISMLWDVVTEFICLIVGYDFYYNYISPYTSAISDTMPQLIISIAIIWLGVKLIRGKKVELDKLEKDEDEEMKSTGGAFSSRENGNE